MALFTPGLPALARYLSNHWPIAVDLTVLELPDGRLRLYFYGADFAVPDPPAHEFFSAVSEDGINFEVEPGIRLQAPGLTDPQVRKAGDEWLMVYLNPNEIKLARSRGGLEFKVDKRFEFDPGSVLMPDGIVRVFGRSDVGTYIALYDFHLSIPGIEVEGTPTPGGKILPNIGDASCIRRLNGAYYMAIKKAP